MRRKPIVLDDDDALLGLMEPGMLEQALGRRVHVRKRQQWFDDGYEDGSIWSVIWSAAAFVLGCILLAAAAVGLVG